MEQSYRGKKLNKGRKLEIEAERHHELTNLCYGDLANWRVRILCEVSLPSEDSVGTMELTIPHRKHT